MISNCGHDENGAYTGGKAGDQSGTEWCLRDWYNGSWLGCFIHPKDEVNELMAELAIESAENDLIGYDQNQRLTFGQQLKACGTWHPKDITVKCEADCSSGIAALTNAVGWILGDEKLQAVPSSMYTGNEESCLVQAGYYFYDAEKYRTSDAYLPRGAILLSSVHTCTIVTDGSKVEKTTEPSASEGALEVDGYWGSLTTAALQRHFGTVVDGEVWGQAECNRARLAACTSGWCFEADDEADGSPLIRAMQTELGGLEVDGIIGEKTIKALERHYGTEQDGILEAPSLTVMAMQRALNAGTF